MNNLSGRGVYHTSTKIVIVHPIKEYFLRIFIIFFFNKGIAVFCFFRFFYICVLKPQHLSALEILYRERETINGFHGLYTRRYYFRLSGKLRCSYVLIKYFVVILVRLV